MARRSGIPLRGAVAGLISDIGGRRYGAGELE